MTSVRLRLAPESVAAAGGTLAGIAQRMADDVAVLENTVHGAAHPWGDDESGSTFAVAYSSILGHALAALGSYVQQVGDAALTLAVQARSMAGTDADAAASFVSLAPPTDRVEPVCLARPADRVEPVPLAPPADLVGPGASGCSGGPGT
jgi:hypothetical protein